MELFSLYEVEMFSKAAEIQSLVNKPVDLKFDISRIGWDEFGRIWFKKAENKLVWLPYQEDLQIIANHKSLKEFERIDFLFCEARDHRAIRVLLSSFDNFMDTLLLNESIRMNPRLSQFGSVRQLWLEFVMENEYGKTWNGSDWIKK